MTASGVESRPSDWLLAWLSARGRASPPTVDRACRAIAERFDPRFKVDRSPTHQNVGPLKRIGHVEEVAGGLAVVPTTLCWSPKTNRGLIVGARDGVLLEKLRLRLGPSFVETRPDPPWPATWCVAGEHDAVETAMADLGIAMVAEAGMRLLASLPTLEEAIATWPDYGQPSAQRSWEVADDPRIGQWIPVDGRFVVDGLVRDTDRKPRVWMIQRGSAWRLVDSPEKRAVAWWAELARQGRSSVVYDRDMGRLVLPSCHLPPPMMIERPLIWASAGPPGQDSRKSWTHEAIEPERAAEVARILGFEVRDAS